MQGVSEQRFPFSVLWNTPWLLLTQTQRAPQGSLFHIWFQCLSLPTNSHYKDYLIKINKSGSDTKLEAGWVPFYLFWIIQDQFCGKQSRCVVPRAEGHGTGALGCHSRGHSREPSLKMQFCLKSWKPEAMKSGRTALGKAQWGTNLSPNSAVCKHQQFRLNISKPDFISFASGSFPCWLWSGPKCPAKVVHGIFGVLVWPLPGEILPGNSFLYQSNTGHEVGWSEELVSIS